MLEQLQRAVFSRVGVTLLTACLLLACIGLRYAQMWYINHDSFGIITFDIRVMDYGEKLYVDIPEPNPPLVFLEHMPVVWLSRVTGWSLPVAFNLALLLLVFSSLGLAHWTSRVVQIPELPAQRWWLTWVWLALAVPVAGYGAGERGYVLFIVLLPYLFEISGQLRERPLSTKTQVLIGLWAAFGVALKPHFFLVPILLELRLMGSKGWRASVRPTLLAMAASILIYGAYTLLLTEWLVALGPWLSHYSFTNRPLGSLLWAVGLHWWLLTLGLWAATRKRWGRAGLWPLDEFVLLAGIAMGVAAFAQQKGWVYHVWPSTALRLLLIAMLLEVMFRALPGLLAIAALTLVGAILQLTAMEITTPGDISLGCPGTSTAAVGSKGVCSVREMRAQLAEHLAVGDPVLWISSRNIPVVALSSLGVVHMGQVPTMLATGSYPRQAWLSRPFPYHPLDALDPVESAVLFGANEVLQRTKPVVVVFDLRPPHGVFGVTDFTWEDFYLRDPALREALSSGYSRQLLGGSNGSHAIWVRRAAASGPHP